MSCLINKFQHYIQLDERDRSLLNSMEEESEHYKKRAVICDQDESVEHVYVIKSGWCASFSQLMDGSRLILNIHFPGDIIGATTLPFETSVCGLKAITDVELCPFPKEGIKKVFEQSPKLAALFFAMGMQENVVFIDRLKAVGRMEGKHRLILLFLQIWARLKVTNKDMAHDFSMPLSQEMLGDALGLTSVYVNKLLKQLQEEKFITMSNKRITLHHIETLIDQTEFNDRYYKLDTRWYPN